MNQPHTHGAVRSVHHDPADRPFLVIWESTRACQLACRHCRAEAAPGRDPRELNTDEATTLMAQVASFGKPAPIFIITGGDPFERADIYELVRRGKELGLPMAVSPSGTPKLTRETLTKLKEAGASAISLSLDGASAEVHDGFRRVPGTFDRTLAAWQAARDLGIRVQVNTTVTRQTAYELPELLKWVIQYGAMTWSSFLLVPTGRGTDLNALTPAETDDVLNFLYDAGLYAPVKTTEGHHFRRVVLQRQVLEDVGVDHVTALGLGPLYQHLSAQLADLGPVDRKRRPPLHVNAGNGFVFVSHVGTVHPSGFLPIAAGDVREQALPTIYRESPLFLGLRDTSRLEGRCGRCEFASICGGSRSRAFAVTGDPYAEEPLCPYEPGSFPYQHELALAMPSTIHAPVPAH